MEENLVEVVWDRTNPTPHMLAAFVMCRFSWGRVGLDCLTFHIRRPDDGRVTCLRLVILHAVHFSGKSPDICTIQGEGSFDDEDETRRHVGLTYNYATKMGTCHYA